MWQLVNHTPFSAERCFARDVQGAEVWLVAVQGTFAVTSDGSLALADEQEPVNLVPRYNDPGAPSSLMYDSELALTKPATDILLRGHAYAPRERPVAHMNVSLRVNEQAKTLRVTGDRRWRGSLLTTAMTPPEPFLLMPITYERAFGGGAQANAGPGDMDPRNPVGTGLASSRERAEGMRLPNVEHPGALISDWRERPPPAGYGPIDRSWLPRRERAGTYDAHWFESRKPLWPLDLQERFFQCAPDDQCQHGLLAGGEPIALEGLSPRGTLRFCVPKHWLTFRTYFGASPIEHRARLQTIIIEPDVPRVLAVWHTALRCQGRDHLLEKTVIGEKPYVRKGV